MINAPPMGRFFYGRNGMVVSYRWHTGGSHPCFSCSKWNGRIFTTIEDVPDLPVHPHCECFIEALNDPKTDNQLDQAGLEISNLKDAVSQVLADISGYRLTSWFGERILSAVKRLWDDTEQFSKTINIFWANYQDMKKANTIGADKYFHSKANAEAAQLGITGEATADFIGRVREVTDFWKYLLRDKMKVEDIIKDMNEDLKANAYGRQVGHEDPTTPAGDLVKIYRPGGLDKKY